MVYSIKSRLDMEKQMRGAGKRVVIIDFYANWCGPCKSMEPVFDELEKKYGERILVLKVNVDHLATIADEYKVASLPTIVLYKNGQKVRGNIIGADEKGLKQKLAKLI